MMSSDEQDRRTARTTQQQNSAKAKIELTKHRQLLLALADAEAQIIRVTRVRRVRREH